MTARLDAEVPGYSVVQIKHQDGGFLVLGRRDLVVGLSPTLDGATEIARRHFEGIQTLRREKTMGIDTELTKLIITVKDRRGIHAPTLANLLRAVADAVGVGTPEHYNLHRSADFLDTMSFDLIDDPQDEVVLLDEDDHLGSLSTAVRRHDKRCTVQWRPFLDLLHDLEAAIPQRKLPEWRDLIQAVDTMQSNLSEDDGETHPACDEPVQSAPPPAPPTPQAKPTKRSSRKPKHHPEFDQPTILIPVDKK